MCSECFMPVCPCSCPNAMEEVKYCHVCGAELEDGEAYYSEWLGDYVGCKSCVKEKDVE